MAVLNGHIIMQGTQFSLTDVEVMSTTVDIEDVRTHHATSSCSMQAAGHGTLPPNYGADRALQWQV